MIKKTLFLIAILFATLSFSQNKNKYGYLVGPIKKEAFKDPSYSNWFNSRYDSYKPDAATISKLKSAIKGYTIKGFMGTWCGDSRRETPRLYKVLKEAGFNLNNLELYGVDRTKNTPDNLAKELNVFRVPTFIFYKNGKEVGRFVEYARESLEKDFLNIVSGKTYKHSYNRS